MCGRCCTQLHQYCTPTSAICISHHSPRLRSTTTSHCIAGSMLCVTMTMRAIHPALRLSACRQAASRFSHTITTSSPRVHRWQLANPFVHRSSVTGRTSTSSPTTPRRALPHCTAQQVPLMSTQCHARCEDVMHTREELNNIHQPSVLARRASWGYRHPCSSHLMGLATSSPAVRPSLACGDPAYDWLMSPVLCPLPCIHPHLCRRCGPLAWPVVTSFPTYSERS